MNLIKPYLRLSRSKVLRYFFRHPVCTIFMSQFVFISIYVQLLWIILRSWEGHRPLGPTHKATSRHLPMASNTRWKVSLQQIYYVEWQLTIIVDTFRQRGWITSLIYETKWMKSLSLIKRQVQTWCWNPLHHITHGNVAL